MSTAYAAKVKPGSRAGAFIVLILVVLQTLGSVATAKPETWAQVGADTARILDKSLSAYKIKGAVAAVKEVDKAYLGPFESQGMEAAVRMGISGQRAFEHEDLFRQLKREYSSGVPAARAASTIAKLKHLLSQDAAKLDGSGGSSATLFVSSFLIILREGFEAILVIGALAAYMVKSGNQDKVRTIYSAAGLAVLASVATAIVLSSAINVSGASRELIEGLTMLFAVVVLFFVSFWLLSKAQAQAWQNYIQGKIAGSLSTGSMMALWSAAFLAVYREGAETVLFYSALAGGANQPGARGMLVAGFAVGCLALAVVYLIITYGSVKIPMRAFFTVTGNFLYLLAFIFAGGAINELQAGGVVGVTPVAGFPAIEVLGIFPTRETLSLQILLVILYIAGLLYQRAAQVKTLKQKEAI